MSPFYFRPSARLQRYLGRELIADPNLAILEFVKNAYDAGASNVYIAFRLAGPATPSLLIADDGAGMDEAEFEQNWMHPGFSLKSPDAKGLRGAQAMRNRASDKGRTLVGEKGLGRMAAGRLGESLEVFTRRSNRSPWLHVSFNWKDFENMQVAIDEVAIPFDYSTAPDEPPVKSGTILQIRGLSQNWGGRVPGRPAAGRSRNRLGRLKQDLRLLVRPLGGAEADLAIHLDSDSIRDPNDIGVVTPEAAVEEADYVYEFTFDVTASSRIRVKRSLTRSPRLVQQLEGRPKETFGPYSLEDLKDEPNRPMTLSAGPFRGRFFYLPPPAAQRAREVDAIGAGVLLYRDKVLVEPYGLDNDDWLGVAARKAQRQGYALVQPITFSGYVLITRETNPLLVDMSNRLGLLDNEESEEFIQHLRAEFLFFESLVNEELSKRWESREEQAARRSEEALDLAAIRLRAIAHSLGQPLSGIAHDVASVRLVARRRDLPDDAKATLNELVASMRAHLEDATQALARVRDVPVSERTTVPIRQIVESALSEARPVASRLGVSIARDEMPDRNVFVHLELVAEAVAQLVRNASEAAAESGGLEVQIGWRDEGGDLVLEISDNGPGMRGVKPGAPLAPLPSTRGRTGEGISSVMELIAASLGRVIVSDTGRNGSQLDVYLPERIKGLRAQR